MFSHQADRRFASVWSPACSISVTRRASAGAGSPVLTARIAPLGVLPRADGVRRLAQRGVRKLSHGARVGQLLRQLRMADDGGEDHHSAFSTETGSGFSGADPPFGDGFAAGWVTAFPASARRMASAPVPIFSATFSTYRSRARGLGARLDDALDRVHRAPRASIGAPFGSCPKARSSRNSSDGCAEPSISRKPWTPTRSTVSSGSSPPGGTSTRAGNAPGRGDLRGALGRRACLPRRRRRRDQLPGPGLGDQLEVLVRERGAAGGDGGHHARLVEPDRVEVSLDEQRHGFAPDGLAGPVQREEREALLVERRVGRVEVLRLALPLERRPPKPTMRPLSRIGIISRPRNRSYRPWPFLRGTPRRPPRPGVDRRP